MMMMMMMKRMILRLSWKSDSECEQDSNDDERQNPGTTMTRHRRLSLDCLAILDHLLKRWTRSIGRMVQEYDHFRLTICTPVRSKMRPRDIGKSSTYLFHQSTAMTGGMCARRPKTLVWHSQYSCLNLLYHDCVGVLFKIVRLTAHWRV
jgi:hypothetical protein